MKDFFARNKGFIAVIIGTLILILGGVFLFSKGGSPGISGNKVSSSLLVPSNAIETSGFANGSYMPASSSATATLVEFGDYECPACAVYSPLVKQLLTDFAGKIGFVFRNYPLPQHANALISSYAVEAAGLQGKYWQMHDKIYETQNDWVNLSDPKDIFIGYAKDLGLNVDQFISDLSSSGIKDKVQNDLSDVNAIGINETPTFYLNGKKITLTENYNELKSLVQSAVTNNQSQ